MLSTDILFIDGEFTKLRGELLELAIVDYYTSAGHCRIGEWR